MICATKTTRFEVALPLMIEAHIGLVVLMRCECLSPLLDNLMNCPQLAPHRFHPQQVSFTIGSDSCRDGQRLFSERTLQCGSQFQGFPFCVFEESISFQLCSTVPMLPPPPVECNDFDSNLIWSKSECFNATHTLYRSGKCIDGKLRGPIAQLEACGGYCHECSDTQTVCSTSDDPQLACILQKDGSTCEVASTVSFSESCSTQETSFRETKLCVGGKVETDQSEKSCAAKHHDTPKCITCDSGNFCGGPEDTCSTFDSVPAATSPAFVPGTEDGVLCPETNVNINYYQEACYNGTHVRLLQGQCRAGDKTKSESTLISCVEYGEEDSRIHCHECGVSVTCSSLPERTHACERNNQDRTCDAGISDLRGLFGCLNDL